MASFLYTKGAREILNTNIDWVADTIKVMLVQSSYTFDGDEEFVDGGDAADPLSHELGVPGYTGGFGGAGRKSLSSKTLAARLAPDNDVKFDAADPSTWTSLASGETVGAAVIIKEVTVDTDSPVIAFLDLTNTATTGGNFSIVFDATDGMFRLKVQP